MVTSRLEGGRTKAAEQQLAAFIERYSPEIASLARAVLAKMRARLPAAVEMVYDNYNALVVGFSPTERAADAPFSIALYPRWVTLFFLEGALLFDPDRILKGTGYRVRHIVLSGTADLDRPAVRKLMSRAITDAGAAFDRRRPSQLMIKSISARQRPRRPSASAGTAAAARGRSA